MKLLSSLHIFSHMPEKFDSSFQKSYTSMGCFVKVFTLSVQNINQIHSKIHRKKKKIEYKCTTWWKSKCLTYTITYKYEYKFNCNTITYKYEFISSPSLTLEDCRYFFPSFSRSVTRSFMSSKI